MSLPEPIFVANQQAWQSCLRHLQTEPRIAIDLEANSMYAYREQICLVQMTVTGQDYIIDPVAVDLRELGKIIEDPAVEKIFHAAEYDLTLLKREHGWQCQNLFDTMWAARILGYKRYGLANMLDQFFGVAQNKKFQKSNWCKRPLSAEQLHYAQIDTHYLLKLRDHLAEELLMQDCREEALEIFADQTWVTPNDQTFDPNSFWSVSGAFDLTRQQQAVLKSLYAFRDEEAKRRDQPLFKILGDKTLMGLAAESPTNLHDMQMIHGMSHGQIRRYGRSLLQAIADGKQAAPPPFPKRNKRPPDSVCNRYEKLHNWRKTTAQKRGVESDVILSRDAMWSIARQNPQDQQQMSQIEQIGNWRCQAYGAEIIQLLQA